MRSKQFTNDDSAVSPVIGVILMVAITVILAAVIGTFVLGLGDQVSDTTPQASFNFDYNSADGNLTITHEGGDEIEGSQLTFAGNGTESGQDTWDAGAVSAGSSVTIDLNDGSNTEAASGETVRIVWSSSSGSDTQTIAKTEIP